MWVIADLLVTVRTPTGDVRLMPGIAQELSDAVGERVMERAGGRVRKVRPPTTVIEPAASTAKPIYWEDVFGDLCGPAIPELLAKTEPPERFWVVATYRGAIRWIRSDRLRAIPSTGLSVRRKNREQQQP